METIDKMSMMETCVDSKSVLFCRTSKGPRHFYGKGSERLLSDQRKEKIAF
jgi:hypothetical protein